MLVTAFLVHAILRLSVTLKPKPHRARQVGDRKPVRVQRSGLNNYPVLFLRVPYYAYALTLFRNMPPKPHLGFLKTLML